MTRHDVRPAVLEVQQHVEKMQADAGDQHRCDGYQGNEMSAGIQSGADHRALVLAEQFLDALQGDRVDVPGVARDVGDLHDRAVVRRVKAVVHAGRNSQRDVAAVAVALDEFGIAEQVEQGVGKAFGLYHLRVLDTAARADDCIARTDEHRRVVIYRPRALLELADEAVVHAGEAGFLRLAEIEVGEHLPDSEGQIAHQWLLDLAEPADETSQGLSRYAVGEQEVQVFLHDEARDGSSNGHGPVKRIG